MTFKKRIFRAIWGLRLSVCIACLIGQVSGQEEPERVILFIIDGLSPQAPERIKMPHFNALKETGVYYKAMHLPLPLQTECQTSASDWVRSSSMGSLALCLDAQVEGDASIKNQTYLELDREHGHLLLP